MKILNHEIAATQKARICCNPDGVSGSILIIEGVRRVRNHRAYHDVAHGPMLDFAQFPEWVQAICLAHPGQQYIEMTGAELEVEWKRYLSWVKALETEGEIDFWGEPRSDKPGDAFSVHLLDATDDYEGFQILEYGPCEAAPSRIVSLFKNDDCPVIEALRVLGEPVGYVSYPSLDASGGDELPI